MSRAQRLLELLQLLRSHRYPVSGRQLAEKLGRSLRTMYRDIETLRTQGAHIDGEPGLGYVLRPGFLLPPLMFSDEEIEALVFGSRWVAARGDDPLAKAAREALVKISAVLPPDLAEELHSSSLLVPHGGPLAAGDSRMTEIRRAIRSQHKIRITYRDQNGADSERTIWPIAVAFWEKARVVSAWCELRRDFRHFRTDRIVELEVLTQNYAPRRQLLMQQWREQQGIPEES